MCRIAALLCLVVALAVPGAARAQDCPQAVDSARIQTLLKQAEKSIYLVQFESAVVALDEAEVRIPCLSEIATREMLTQLFLFRGVVSFNQSNEVGATTAFRRALAIDPGLQWNERFGQRPRELFLDAKNVVISTPKGRVSLPIPADGVSLYLNSDLQPPEGGERELYAGRHLLQIFKDGALMKGLWVELAGGGMVVPSLPAEAGRMPAPKAVDPGPVADTRASREWMRPASLGALGGGAALAAGGAVTGVLYLQSKAALESGDYYGNRDDPEKEALLQRNRTTALVTDVALPLGAVFIGTGVTLFLMSRGESGQSSVNGVVPWIGPGGGGVAMTLRF